MLDQIRETIERYHLIEQNDHIVLGLSGGPDSVCLFDVLLRLGCSLHVVHVNHMMRGDTALRDQDFVQKLCASYGVPCGVVTVDCPRLAAEASQSLEEVGRSVRYDAFRQAAAALAAAGYQTRIAVAHNADDQAETVLFRILRGSGTDGIAAMEHLRREGDFPLIRPLLDVTRAQIEDYCRERHLEYMTDESNGDVGYSRNRLRLELLPQLRAQYNDRLPAALCRLASIAGEDKDFLWQQAEAAYRACLQSGAQPGVGEGGDGARDASAYGAGSGDPSGSAGRIVLDRARLLALHPAIRRRVLVKALRVAGLAEDLSYERLLAADRLLAGGPGTRVIEMPHGFTVTEAFGLVIIKRRDGAAPGSREERKPEGQRLEVQMEAAPAQVEALRNRLRAEGYRQGEILLDAALVSEASGIPEGQLAAGICLRSRAAGDFLCLRGGRKKLKKLLGEMRIPADEREDVGIIAAGRCVLAVLPMRPVLIVPAEPPARMVPPERPAAPDAGGTDAGGVDAGGAPPRYAEALGITEGTERILRIEWGLQGQKEGR